VDAHHHPAASARRNRHVTADEEREAAEHLLLRDAFLAGHELTDPCCKLLVVRHGQVNPMRIIAPGRNQRSVRRSSGSGRLMQPAVGRAALTCRKIADPRPRTIGFALYSITAK